MIASNEHDTQKGNKQVLEPSIISLEKWLDNYLDGLKKALPDPAEEKATIVTRKPDVAFEYNYKGLYHNQVFKHVYLSGLPWFAEHLIDFNDFLGKFMFEPFSWFYFCSPKLYPHESISPLKMITALACDERERSSFIRHRTKMYGNGQETGEPMIDAVLYRQYVEVADSHLLTAMPKPLSEKIRALWPPHNKFSSVNRSADKILGKLKDLQWHGPAEQQSCVTVSQCEYAGMYMMLGNAHVFDMGKELLLEQIDDAETQQAILQTYGQTPSFVARDGHLVLYHRDKYTHKTWFASVGKFKIFRYFIEGGVPTQKCLTGVEIYTNGSGS